MQMDLSESGLSGQWTRLAPSNSASSDPDRILPPDSRDPRPASVPPASRNAQERSLKNRNNSARSELADKLGTVYLENDTNSDRTVFIFRRLPHPATHPGGLGSFPLPTALLGPLRVRGLWLASWGVWGTSAEHLARLDILGPGYRIRKTAVPSLHRITTVLRRHLTFL